ncbi:MAG: response regulator [Deltaproteobacteria bacterium]|nr:response regulator [Deltaproteobacteria bacterium]
MKKFPCLLIFLLIILFLALASSGIWLYNFQKREILGESFATLEAVCELKAERIIEWLNARKNHASVIMASRYYNPLAGSWLSSPPAEPDIKNVLTGFQVSQNLYKYSDALFVNPEGKIYFRLDPEGNELHEKALEALDSAFRENQALFSDIYKIEGVTPSFFDLVVPFFMDAEGKKIPSGAIIYRYDLNLLMLNFWPAPSKTAETMLVKMDGTNVVLLNDLILKKDSAFNLSIPLSRSNDPSVIAVKLKSGTSKGIDYRGIKILSAFRPIPEMNWHLVTKIDESEVFSSLRFSFLIVLVAFLMCVVCTYTIIAVIWQRKEKSHYRSLFEAESAIRKNEIRYQGILDSMMEGFQIIDFNWNILYMNATAIRFSRLTKNDLINKNILDLFPGIQDSAIYAAFNRCMTERTPQTIIHDFNYPVEGRAWFIFSIQPIPEGIFILSSDITEQHKLQEDKKSLQSQLLQAQKLESIGRLAGGIAHDFNNMLNVILGHVQLSLMSINNDHPLFKGLMEIEKAALRSAELTQQLLAFARKQPISPSATSMNQLISGHLNLLKRLIGEHLELLWIPGADTWPVYTDTGQIHQVLTNLAVNARDAIGTSGRVTIETGNVTFDEYYCRINSECIPGEYVMLSFSDNGCGMDKKTLECIFDPFFTTKEVGKGTGLGLSMVFGIVKQNKGFINVHSEPGMGTTFKIYFPRYLGTEKEIPEKQKNITLTSGNETILLVEDETLVRDLAILMLERLGYKVISASTPNEAIKLAEKHLKDISLMMVDVVMPEMTGRELAEHILKMRPDLKILYMSGYTADVIAHHGVLDSNINFIQKPLFLDDLSAKIREILDSSS